MTVHKTILNFTRIDYAPAYRNFSFYFILFKEGLKTTKVLSTVFTSFSFICQLFITMARTLNNHLSSII